MTLNVQDARAHVLHTLATDEIPSVGLLRILNDAGHWMCSVHQWKWREVARRQLDFEGGKDYVWLPNDFQELVGYGTTQGTTSGFMLTGHQQLLRLQTLSITTTNWVYRGVITHAPRYERASGSVTVTTNVSNDDDTYVLDDRFNPAVTFSFQNAAAITETATLREVIYGAANTDTAANLADAINGSPSLDVEAYNVAGTTLVTLTHKIPGTAGNSTVQTDSTTGSDLALVAFTGGLDGGAPRARLDLWPDISADEENALTIYYRAGWDVLDADSEFVSIPDWCEQLYLQVLRAVARGYEREDAGSMTARLGEIMQGPIWAAALLRDRAMQPDYGEMLGGAVGSGSGGQFSPFWNYTSVAAPS